MDQKLSELHEEHTHAPLDRRVFLERPRKLTGGVASALAPLRQAGHGYAAINGYLVRPKGAAKLPAVIVEAANKKLVIHVYEGANQAFKNDDCEARCQKPPADLARRRTVAFLKELLKT